MADSSLVHRNTLPNKVYCYKTAFFDALQASFN